MSYVGATESLQLFDSFFDQTDVGVAININQVNYTFNLERATGAVYLRAKVPLGRGRVPRPQVRIIQATAGPEWIHLLISVNRRRYSVDVEVTECGTLALIYCTLRFPGME